jgi:hypothetical protein
LLGFAIDPWLHRRKAGAVSLALAGDLVAEQLALGFRAARLETHARGLSRSASTNHAPAAVRWGSGAGAVGSGGVGGGGLDPGVVGAGVGGGLMSGLCIPVLWRSGLRAGSAGCWRLRSCSVGCQSAALPAGGSSGRAGGKVDGPSCPSAGNPRIPLPSGADRGRPPPRPGPALVCCPDAGPRGPAAQPAAGAPAWRRPHRPGCRPGPAAGCCWPMPTGEVAVVAEPLDSATSAEHSPPKGNSARAAVLLRRRV